MFEHQGARDSAQTRGDPLNEGLRPPVSNQPGVDRGQGTGAGQGQGRRSPTAPHVHGRNAAPGGEGCVGKEGK